MPRLESIKNQLSYDPVSGNFVWLVQKNSRGGKIKPGSIAGTNKDGYVQIKIDGKIYRAHRLAWFVSFGNFPDEEFEIDHINGIRSDNRLDNLRIVSRTQNNMNMSASKANKSGVRGVSWRKERGKWHSRIKVDGRVILLGDFVDINDAKKARLDAEQRFWGEFSRST